jgi:hypothetical protein
VRRNPDYQADFERAIQQLNAREGEYAPVKAELDAMGKFLRSGEWVEGVASGESRTKWLLWCYLNPEVDLPGASPFVEIGKHSVRRRLEVHEFLIKYDLRLPIEPQQRRAQERLERRQANQTARGQYRRRSPRNQPGKWPLYLRVLDARASGASYQEIGAEVFGIDDAIATDPRTTVDSALKQARRMTRQGYRDILLRPEI